MTTNGKLGMNASWSMAVGGMVGGGIFSTLGVVIGLAGVLAWLSYLAAGLVALASGYAYVKLAAHYQEGGGAFTYLGRIGAPQSAASLAWVLIAGYVLTNAVYAFTFGEYLGYVTGLGAWFPRVMAVAIIAAFIAVNLRGTGEAGGVEVLLVWFKLAVLWGLGAWGLISWRPDLLHRGAPAGGIFAALFAASSVFMAYEGFQLLAYDYDDVKSPRTTLPRAVLTAIVLVIGTYMVVAVGTAMLVGTDTIMQQQEVALAVAGRAVFGTAGLVIVTIAAAFSTGSAINSTLFATARLSRLVADKGQLPALFGTTNNDGIPAHAVIALGSAAALLAVIGSLLVLVEAASLAFLITFTVVCGLAWKARAGARMITAPGTVAATMATIGLIVHLARTEPFALLAFAVMVAVAVFVRPKLVGNHS